MRSHTLALLPPMVMASDEALIAAGITASPLQDYDEGTLDAVKQAWAEEAAKTPPKQRKSSRRTSATTSRAASQAATGDGA